MFGLGFSEMLMVMFVALIAIGPKRLPGVAKAIGRGYAEFRNAMDEMRATVYREVHAPLAEVQKPLKETSAEYLDKLLKEREEAKAEEERKAAAMYEGSGEKPDAAAVDEVEVEAGGVSDAAVAGEGLRAGSGEGSPDKGGLEGEARSEPGGSPAVK